MDDRRLVRRVRAGDTEAFGDLVERYRRLVHGLILEQVRPGDDLDDLVQETFRRAFTQLDQLRRGRRFGAWLGRIAGSVALDYLRRREVRGREETLAGVVAFYRHHRESSPEERVEASDTAQRLWAAVDDLPPEYRRLIVLHYVEGCRVREIARFLDLSPANVKFRMHRARNWLKDELASLLREEVVDESRAKERGQRNAILAALPLLPALSESQAPRRLPRALWPWVPIGGIMLAGLGAWYVGGGHLGETPAVTLLPVAGLDGEIPSVSVIHSPAKPQSGQRVEFVVTLRSQDEDAFPEIHWLIGPWDPREHVLSLVQNGEEWRAAMTVPDGAAAVFYYVTSGPEPAARYSWVSQLTNSRLLQRYERSFLIHGEGGRPVRHAWLTCAQMTRWQEGGSAASMVMVRRELALHPDNLRAYNEKRYLLGKMAQTGDEWLRTGGEGERDRATLRLQRPDRPDLWMAPPEPVLARYRPFLDDLPAGIEVEEWALKLATQQAEEKRAAWLRAFLTRYPHSVYADEAWSLLLLNLANTGVTEASRLSEELMSGRLEIPVDAGQEAQQRWWMSSTAGYGPRSLAYSVCFDLCAIEGDTVGCDAVTCRLITSDIGDPRPYLYIARALIGKRQESIRRGTSPVFPRRPQLAVELLETAAALAPLEAIEELPGIRIGSTLGSRLTKEEALRLRTQLVRALGETYAEMGRCREAVLCLEEALVNLDLITLRRAPGRAAVLSQLGRMHEKLADRGEARLAYRRSLDILGHDPDLEEAMARLEARQLSGPRHPTGPSPRTLPPLTLTGETERIHLGGFGGQVVVLYYDFGRDNRSAEWRRRLADWRREMGAGVVPLFVYLWEGGGRDRSERDGVITAWDDDGMCDRLELAVSTLFLIDDEGGIRLRRELSGDASLGATDLAEIEAVLQSLVSTMESERWRERDTGEAAPPG